MCGGSGPSPCADYPKKADGIGTLPARSEGTGPGPTPKRDPKPPTSGDQE